jgi:hypothetical protein
MITSSEADASGVRTRSGRSGGQVLITRAPASASAARSEPSTRRVNRGNPSDGANPTGGPNPQDEDILYFPHVGPSSLGTTSRS